VGKAIGKGINEFKDALSGPKKAVDETKEAVKSATTIDVTAGAKNDEKHKEAND
jgi:twin arginine-targeting protein translocase, tatA/E family